MTDLEEKITRLYKSMGMRVPLVPASSPPVGAFLAPMLAHLDVVNPKTIQQTKDEAWEFVHGSPSSRLIRKHRDWLSHNTKSGCGAWRYHPGSGGSGYSNGWSSTRTFLEHLRAERWNGPGFTVENGAIRRSSIRACAPYFHKIFGARVRYHTVIETGYDQIMFWPNKRFCVVCNPPAQLLRNNNRQLHSIEKGAVRWHDGFKLGFVNGITIPMKYIERRSLLTLSVINKERNVEVKRGLIEVMGYERWLKQSKANLLASDTDADGRDRKLWRMMDNNNIRLNVLEVFNSTPEPDGSFKKYFLQVPGNTWHIKQALNWMLDGDRTWVDTMLIET